MKRRIFLWAIAGFFIAGIWALYAAWTSPSPLITARPFVWALANITCPIAFASFHLHFGIKVYLVLLVNAATYGLVGLAIESLRQQLRPTKQSQVA
jgi:hypothetical protein